MSKELRSFCLPISLLWFGQRSVLASLKPRRFLCQSNEFVHELLRGVRQHFDRFIKDLKVWTFWVNLNFLSSVSASCSVSFYLITQPGDLEKAQLGLAHSYSRAKVKFNFNRVDDMVIQAIFVLDTLDKDIIIWHESQVCFYCFNLSDYVLSVTSSLCCVFWQRMVLVALPWAS